MVDSLVRRRARLPAALGFLEIRWRGHTPDAAIALQRWLHSWPGLGAVVTGMHAQGFVVELKQGGGTCHARFCPTGLPHSIIYGTATELSPWRAVQRVTELPPFRRLRPGVECDSIGLSVYSGRPSRKSRMAEPDVQDRGNHPSSSWSR